MTEHAADSWADDDVEGAEAAEAAERPAQTGVEDVDAVVDAVAGLDELDPAEHVAVFEAAHSRLRATLDAPTG
ncbi:hypothetical protein GCM10023340_45730 [Nocardioides marinquilinus]|uniref:Uncharacterized protein n=1 Tax=Nocardioides marinquilinus TaxID=1210400 RepID=A0ABP9Q4N6_9ACTN